MIDFEPFHNFKTATTAYYNEAHTFSSYGTIGVIVFAEMLLRDKRAC